MGPTRRSILAGGLASGLIPAPPDPPRDPGAFARLIADLSAPETGPSADNLVSNEDSYPRVAGDLDRLAPPGSVYLGVGPDQNFTHIAHARPSTAFILDFRRRNALLHLVHKALFSLSPDRAAYLSRLTARSPITPLPRDPTAADLVAAFGPATLDRAALARTIADVWAFLKPTGALADADAASLATIQSKLAGPGLDARFLALRMYPTLSRLMTTPDRSGRPAHFLASEALYRTVQALHRNDRVVPLVGDFAGPAPLPRLADWLRSRSLSVGVLYVSDVEFFLLRSGTFAGYVANLSRLPWSDGALIVRASTREIVHPDRAPGDSSTTIVRPARAFLDEARAGRIRSVDDLFRAG